MVSKDHQPARQNVEDEKVFCKFRQLDDDFIMGVLSALEDEGIEAASRPSRRRRTSNEGGKNV